MNKEIVRDTFFLSMKSKEATKEDAQIGQDLVDTLIANSQRCVGLAGNMIGYQKRVIVFMENKKPVLMYNPVYLKKEGPYKAVEGCLSLDGERETIRYNSIKVEYLNEKFQKRIKTYKGFTAQIIQHEMDHLEGILI
ncbi:MAG: peptide deformylase [Firmicutes bacterium]|nr:peptide deformylase [Bacillota bacterium]